MLIPFGILSAAGTGGVVAGGAGYFISGRGGGTDYTTIDKYLFPSETRVVNNLSVVKRRGDGMANSGVAGYFTDVADTARVSKMAFPSDTVTELGTGLSVGRQDNRGFANSGVAGYFAGGSGPSTTVDKFAFPSDTRTTLGTGLSGGRTEGAAFANSGTAGYHVGGFNGSVNTATTDKFAFPSDTRSTITVARVLRNGGGCANSGVAGYASCGVDDREEIIKLTFSTDTSAQITPGIFASGGLRQKAFADSGVAGYFNAASSQIVKFAFPTDTRSIMPVGLSVSREVGSSFANSVGL